MREKPAAIVGTGSKKETNTLLPAERNSAVNHAIATAMRHVVDAEKRMTWTMFADVATTTIANTVQNVTDTENVTIATNGMTTQQR